MFSVKIPAGEGKVEGVVLLEIAVQRSSNFAEADLARYVSLQK